MEVRQSWRAVPGCKPGALWLSRIESHHFHHIKVHYRKFLETCGKESYPVRLVHVKQHLPALVEKNFSVL